MKKPAHTKLDSKTVNQAVLGAKAVKAHKVVSEKEAIHTALYGMDNNAKHHDLVDATLTSADLEILKQLESDQAHWVATDNQDEATISIAYTDSVNSITTEQPVADLYAFDTQWSQAQLESINSHISSSVNAAAQPLWTLLLGGAVVGGVALAASGGGSGSSEAPNNDAQLFEAFCQSTIFDPDTHLYSLYPIQDQNNEYHIFGGFERSAMADASSAIYSVNSVAGTHDFTIDAAGIAILLSPTSGDGYDSASVSLYAQAYSDTSNGSDIIWLKDITIQSYGSGYTWNGPALTDAQAFLSVNAQAQANGATAEIGICDITMNINLDNSKINNSVHMYGQAYLEISATASNEGSAATVLVHDINIGVAVSGYAGNESWRFLTADATLSVSSNARALNSESTIELGNITMVAEASANNLAEPFYTSYGYANVDVVTLRADASSVSAQAHLSAGLIDLQAINNAYYRHEAAYINVGSSDHALTANATYTNSQASLNISGIKLYAAADDYASATIYDILAHAESGNAVASVNIGDISIESHAVNGNAHASIGDSNYDGYGIKALATTGGGDNPTNASAEMTINSISITAESFYGSGHASLYEMYASADSVNGNASITINDGITISGNSANRSGYAHVQYFGATANATGAEASLLVNGDVKIEASSTEDSSYASLFNIEANARDTKTVANVVFNNVEVLASGSSGYFTNAASAKMYNASAYATGVSASANLTINNLTISANAARDGYAYAFLENIEAYANSDYAKANVNIGDVLVQSIGYSGYYYNEYSTSSHAGAQLYDVEAYANDLSTEANVTVNSIKVYGSAIYGTGYAQMESIYANANSDYAKANLNILGNVEVKADSVWDTASASIQTIYAAAHYSGSKANLTIDGNVNISAISTFGNAYASLSDYLYASANHTGAIANLNILGDLNITASGSGSYVTAEAYSVYAYANHGSANVSIGNIGITANNYQITDSNNYASGYLDLYSDARNNGTAHMTVGNINMSTYGEDSSINLMLRAYNTDDSISTLNVGDINLENISTGSYSHYDWGIGDNYYYHAPANVEVQIWADAGAKVTIGDVSVTQANLGTYGYGGDNSTYMYFNVESESSSTYITMGNDLTFNFNNVGYNYGYATLSFDNVDWNIERTLNITGQNEDVNVNLMQNNVSQVFGAINLLDFNGNLNLNIGGLTSDQGVLLTNQYEGSGSNNLISDTINFTTVYGLDLSSGLNSIETNGNALTESNFINLTPVNYDPIAHSPVFTSVSGVDGLWNSITEAFDGTNYDYVFALFDESGANTDLNGDGEFGLLGVLASDSTNIDGADGLNNGQITSLLFIDTSNAGINHLTYDLIDSNIV